MNEEKLSQRLATVANYVPLGARLADIGSDHAYLPAWLILHGKINFAIAGEVVQGPFESAGKLVAKRDLASQIEVRLGDGLEVVSLEDELTAISIAGMGGALISEILERGVKNQRLTGKERLILQPNVAEKTLRSWLQKNQYHIFAEEILAEDGKFYEVIVAEKSPTPVTYSEKELTFGPWLNQAKSDVYYAKWQQEGKQLQQVLAQLHQAKIPPVEKIKEVEQVLAWLAEEVSS